MTEEKKKGFLAKIFGPKKSSCCNLRIEEVTEDDKNASEKKGSADNARPKQAPPCCGQQAKK